jgi:alpha-L-rhamnosidase
VEKDGWGKAGLTDGLCGATTPKVEPQSLLMRRGFISRSGLDLTWVNAGDNSIHGPIVSHWRREQDRLTLKVSIPPNTTATVHVPVKPQSDVSESGRLVKRRRSIKFIGSEDGCNVYQVGSGTFEFQSRF